MENAWTASRHAAVSAADESRLNVTVVFTSAEGTVAALRAAGSLAGRLRGRITLVAPVVVSCRLPLNEPQVRHEWNERRLQAMAAAAPVETIVQVYLCRDRDETLGTVLKPHSLVVIGGSKHWWPTAGKRLAKRLRSGGHEVIFTETE